MKRVECSKQGRSSAHPSADFAKFHNPKVLREILGSRQDIDWVNTPTTYLLGQKIKHPDFSGDVVQLFHKVFGVPKTPGKKIPPISDLQMLIWFAMEDRVIDEDNRKLEQLTIAIQHEDLRPDKRLEVMEILEEKIADAKRRHLENILEQETLEVPIGKTPRFRVAVRELAYELFQLGVEVSHENLARELKIMYYSSE